MRELARQARQSAPFPPPPIPGNEHIQPIINAAELLEEGRIMRHCAGSYAGSVRRRECFVYRILQPARATLEIAPTIFGRWEVSQIKGYYNAKPGKGVIKAVREWMRQHSA